MRRQLLFIAVLLCALVVSGWGGVLAAALCPHAARAAAKMATAKGLADDHACCHAKKAEADEHCSKASHEATGDMEMRRQPAAESEALATPAESCSYCIGHNGLPTAPVSPRESQPNSSNSNHAVSQNVRPVEPPAFVFVSAIVPAQGAPPGPLARKYLLLNVFLI